MHLRLEPLAAALARKARRPVQWKLTREEVFLTGHCHASVVRIKTGVKRDGTILARQVEAVYDTGRLRPHRSLHLAQRRRGFRRPLPHPRTSA